MKIGPTIFVFSPISYPMERSIRLLQRKNLVPAKNVIDQIGHGHALDGFQLHVPCHSFRMRSRAFLGHIRHLRDHRVIDALAFRGEQRLLRQSVQQILHILLHCEGVFLLLLRP